MKQLKFILAIAAVFALFLSSIVSCNSGTPEGTSNTPVNTSVPDSTVQTSDKPFETEDVSAEVTSEENVGETFTGVITTDVITSSEESTSVIPEGTSSPEISTSPEVTTAPEATTKVQPAITDPQHTHVFSSEWKSDNLHHWKECSCGEKSDFTVHTQSTVAAVAATCTNSGKTAGSYCSVCGRVLTAQQIIASTGHIFGEWTVFKAATCTEIGTESRTCSVCNTVENRAVLALGHNYSETVVPPTTKEDGYTVHICARCGDSFTDNIVRATGSTGLAYKENGDGTCTITGIGTCSDNEIYVPSTIDNLVVVGIGDKAFENQTAITMITLPDTITVIGIRAYSGCTNLKETNIPKSIQLIGLQPFFKSGIENVVYSSDRGFDEETAIFSGTPLKSIIIDHNSVPRYICYGCTSLTNVVFSKEVRSISDHSFHGCKSLTSINIHNGIQTIGEYAFSDCTSLTSVILPESVNNDYWANVGIGSFAFSGCTNLKNITILGYMKTIHDGVFQGCSSLERVEMPNSKLESVGSAAFYGCTSLTSIPVFEAVTSMGDSVFRNCSSLTSITILENEWSVAWTIENNTFSGCTNLVSLSLPYNIISIGNGAFSGCEKLSSIVIPDLVTSIGNSAFLDCCNLTNITIPDTVTRIGNYAFQNCQSLTSVTIPDSVTTLGNGAFKGCTSLTIVSISCSLTTIPKGVFNNCSSLTSVTIPSSVTSIGSEAFELCQSLTEINYLGSTNDWNSISLGEYWQNPELVVVHCIDGDIYKQ